MPFIFWSGLAFLLGCAFCVHFDVFGFRRKLTRKFLSAFSFVLPKTDPRGRRMKFGMAKTAAYISAVIIWLLLTSIFFSYGIPISSGVDENKYTGPLGDLFNGILTPVLTFLTFCGLLVTILIQNIQMKTTLLELELTRQEMAESTEALQAQVINSEAQKLDNNFYSMLENFRSSIDEINKNTSYDDMGIEIKSAFEIYVFNKMRSSTMTPEKAEEYWKSVKEKFLGIFLIHYQILKYLDEYDGGVIGANEKKRYANILRAMTPHKIQFLIFLNCAFGDFEKYRGLLERYKMFEHLYFDRIPFFLFKLLAPRYSLAVYGDKIRLKNYLRQSSDVANILWKSSTYLRRMRNDIAGGIEDIELKQMFLEKSGLKIDDFESSLRKALHHKEFDMHSFIVSEDSIFREFLKNNCFYFFKKMGADCSVFSKCRQQIKKLTH